MFENLQYGDRHPPLHHVVLWLTVKALGDGEMAVRLPSLIAGTLVIPALYLLGRELYDRRTGLFAAAFGMASPLLIWYAEEARMYAFVTLFGLLALWTQLRVIRKPSMLNWAALHPRHRGAAVVALLRPAADRRPAAHLGRVLSTPGAPASRSGRSRSASPTRWPSWRCSSCRCSTFAQKQFESTAGAAGSPAGTLRRPVLLRGRVEHRVGAVGLPPGQHHRAAGGGLAAAAAAVAAAAGPRRLAPDDHPRRRRDLADRDPDLRRAVRPRAVRGPLLPRRRPAAVPAHRPARDGLGTQARRAAGRRWGRSSPRCCSGSSDSRPTTTTRACTTSAAPWRRSRPTPGRAASSSTSRPTCATCSSTTRRELRSRPLRDGSAQRGGGQPGVRPRLVPGQPAVPRPHEPDRRQDGLPAQAAAAASRSPRPRCGCSDEQPPVGRPAAPGHLAAGADLRSASARARGSCADRRCRSPSGTSAGC